MARFPVPSKKIHIFITIFVPQTHHTLSEFSTIRTIKPMDDPTSDDGATDEIYGKILVQYSEKIVAHGRDLSDFIFSDFET